MATQPSWRIGRKIVVCPSEPIFHGGTNHASVHGPVASPVWATGCARRSGCSA